MRVWASLSVAVSALGFQTMVLYPWHHELSTQLKDLQQTVEQQNVVLQQYASKGK
jgi:hypothetical protein